jgi:hypothetical protein
MWKLIVAFLLFAAVALWLLSKGGPVDISGEKHGIETSPAAEHASAPAAAASLPAPEAAAAAQPVPALPAPTMPAPTPAASGAASGTLAPAS